MKGRASNFSQRSWMCQRDVLRRGWLSRSQSVCGGAFCFVDDEGIHWSPGCNQAQAELILNRREEGRGGGLRWRHRYFAAELSFVGSPLEVEVEFTRESGLVDHGA